MIKIKDLTAQKLVAHQQQTKQPPASQNGIDKIWLVMAGIFGTKWTNSMGFDPTNMNAKTWRAVMRGITDDQIDKGLIAFSDTDAKFIPAATEFKALCRYNGSSREQAAFDAQEARLPPMRWLTDENKIARNKDAGRSALDEMKRLTKG